VELLSPSDNLDQTRQKMQEYLDQGIRLGWLILPQQEMVEIYRPQQPVEVQENPTMLSGETVLPEFELDLTKIW
jgi:Uma2 family endonuclease